MENEGVVAQFWMVSFSLPGTSVASQPHPLLGMASVQVVSRSRVLADRPSLSVLSCQCPVGDRPGPAGMHQVSTYKNRWCP